MLVREIGSSRSADSQP